MKNKNNYVSCRGNGAEGWKRFIKVRTPYEGLPYPVSYLDNYATGTFLDITPGLFAEGVEEMMCPFFNDNGTYPTGVCEDYTGNWMLRRSLWTDEDGTEHVAEGTVSPEGEILEPIKVVPHKYANDTVYPLNGSWDDAWKIADKATWDKTSLYVHTEAGYVNLVVPLSFFDFVQHEYKMYAFSELSSRTFFTGLSRMENGNILIDCIFDVIRIVWDPWDIDEENVFFKGILSPDGQILEPLHIEIPEDTDTQEYEEKYAEYFQKNAYKPQPWNRNKKTK